jgi:hypothetical protein
MRHFIKERVIKLLLCVFIVAMLSVACSKKEESKNFINLSKDKIMSTYNNIKIGSDIKSVEKELGEVTAITNSNIEGADKQYVWMALIDYGDKYVKVDVDKNGKIVNKTAKVDVNK